MAGNIEPSEIDDKLKAMPEWERKKDPDSIHRSFEFKNFKEAFKFMTSCAAYAEKIAHHPDWTNRYNKIDVTLTTHDLKAISNLDVLMAEYMHQLYNKRRG